MSTQYAAHIWSPDGSRKLAVVTNFADAPDAGGAALDYALNVGQVGALSLTLPATFDDTLLPLDARIGVWRSINGRAPQLDGQAVYLVRGWVYTDTSVTAIALHANHLWRRRIVAYDAGSSYTSKAAAPAGNLIKTYTAEQMLSGVTADRDLSSAGVDISAYLTRQADIGDGASLVTQVTRKHLFDVVRELCDASTAAGSYLTAEIVAPSPGTLQARTYAGQRGRDHRAGSGQPIVLSPETGTLERCRLTIDRQDEVTAVICGGQGEQASRLIRTAVDTVRAAESPLNWIELFGDYSGISDGDALQDVADALLRAGRPRITLEADLIETDRMTRGLQYDLGDLVTASFRGRTFDARLDVVGVTLSGGKQQSRVQLRSMV